MSGEIPTWEQFCRVCGWPVHREHEIDRRAATTPAGADGYHWRHAVEPTYDHDAEPGGEPNEQVREIYARHG